MDTFVYIHFGLNINVDEQRIKCNSHARCTRATLCHFKWNKMPSNRMLKMLFGKMYRKWYWKIADTLPLDMPRDDVERGKEDRKNTKEKLEMKNCTRCYRINLQIHWKCCHWFDEEANAFRSECKKRRPWNLVIRWKKPPLRFADGMACDLAFSNEGTKIKCMKQKIGLFFKLKKPKFSERE